MKTCPVCNERSFDDAEVCYGCLHRFGEGDRAPAPCMPSAPSERAALDRREDEQAKPAGCDDARAPTGMRASELVVRIELPGFVTAIEGPRPRVAAIAQ